jgi:amidase
MPGTLSQADIAVAGPMARDVDDLEMALDLLAGPDSWNQLAYSLTLPAPRHKQVKDFRVAVWIDEETAPISDAYRTLLLSAAAAFQGAGAHVDYEARPGFTFEKAVDTYNHLLSAAEAATWTLSEIEEHAASNEEPQGELGIAYASMRHREWLSWHERRMQQRNRWQQFFESFDVVLMPVTLTEAIRHDHSSPFTGRTVQVDEQQRPYTDQLKWVGLTGVSWLPSTVVPIGQINSKPVGVQIAGPFLEDRTTLAAGRFLQEALGGFQKPKGF